MSPRRKVPELPAELPENVVLFRPAVVPDVVVKQRPKRPKRAGSGAPGNLRSVTPSVPDLGAKTPVRSGEKPSSDSVLTMTPASLQLSENADEASSVLNPKQLQAEFQKLVLSMGKMELRKRFPLEAAAYGDMKGRARTHGAVIHPEFADFRGFLLHVGARPLPTWTLDRKNPHDPEYAPGKVRWADKRTQANNRRNTIMLTIGEETRPLTDWARRTKQDPKNLRKRLDNGCTHEEVVYGRNQRAPEPATEPVEPVDAEGYVWPGSERAQAFWEEGFRSFVAFTQHNRRLRMHGADAVTRDAFLAWIGGNILEAARFELIELWPYYGDPDWDEPQELRDHPTYLVVQVYRWPVLEARCRASGSRAQRALLENTLKFFSRPTRPHKQNWAVIFDG
ncbi:hypothetical protein [Methylobacterium sp. A52T]